MKSQGPTEFTGTAREAKTAADPLQPANLSVAEVERQLRQYLPAVQAEVERLKRAKVVSQKTLNFRFTI